MLWRRLVWRGAITRWLPMQHFLHSRCRITRGALCDVFMLARRRSESGEDIQTDPPVQQCLQYCQRLSTVSSYTILRWMVGWLLNEVERIWRRKHSWSHWDTFFVFAWKNWYATRKNLDLVAGVSAEIRTEHTSIKRYRCTSPVCVVHMYTVGRCSHLTTSSQYTFPLANRSGYLLVRSHSHLTYCDRTPESRNSGARIDVHCYSTTR
jgi:hypothetical protein